METARKEVCKMQRVYLNGGIAQFGAVWEANCKNIRDIFKLIDCQTVGFRQYLIEAAESGVGFEIQRGSEILSEETELFLSLNEEDIIITEVPAGSKSAGAKILAALAIAALFFIPGGQFLYTGTQVAAQSGAAVGGAGAGTMTVAGGALSTPGLIAASIAVNLAITGISQLMMPGPEVDQGTDESYLFDGPSNSTEQGLPVPVAYGELIVGGAPISQYYSGISAWEDFGTATEGGRIIETPLGNYFIPTPTFEAYYDSTSEDEGDQYNG